MPGQRASWRNLRSVMPFVQGVAWSSLMGSTNGNGRTAGNAPSSSTAGTTAPLPSPGNSVRLEICHGQRFMVVDLRAGCQYGQRTAKLTVWLGGGLRRDWSWGRHVEAQNDHDSAEHKTPRPVQQSTGRCLGEHGN